MDNILKFIEILAAIKWQLQNIDRKHRSLQKNYWNYGWIRKDTNICRHVLVKCLLNQINQTIIACVYVVSKSNNDCAGMEEKIQRWVSENCFQLVSFDAINVGFCFVIWLYIVCLIPNNTFIGYESIRQTLSRYRWDNLTCL